MDQYCPVCGNLCRSGEAFCQNCGTRLPEAAPTYVPPSQQTNAAPATPVYAPPVYPEPMHYAPQQSVPDYAANSYGAPPPAKPKKKKTGLIVTLCGVAVLIAACVLLYFFVLTPSSVELSETELELACGDSETLTAEIAPGSAILSKDMTWESSDPDIAEVSKNGKVTAVTTGTCKITATTANGKSASCTVTVAEKPVDLEYISLSDRWMDGLKPGETFTLSVEFYPSDATDQSISWRSSDPAVATVDQNGTVTAVGAGSCEIIAAASNGSSGSCTVTVGENTVALEFISLSDYWVEDLKVGDKYTLSVEFYPADATNKYISWSSSDAAVATVDQNGTVTAVGAGSCEIIATAANGKSASCNVEVTISTKPVTSSEIKVGDYVVFGSYEQDNYSYNGAEAIEWLVLDKQGSNVLLISRYALDCQLFNGSMSNATWDMSSVRTWLNETFYNSAFSAEERSRILNTTVAASGNPTFNTNPGGSTYDKVFLLSISEANWYFGSDAQRQCKATAYCNARGAYVGTGGNCWWWLRTPGNRDGSAANVSSSGALHYDGNDTDSAAGAVRPVMWITVG